MTYRLLPFLLLIAMTTVACGGMRVYAPSRAANFNLDAELEINDEDIRKAFEARPQLPDTLRVAYYSFDPDKKDDLEALIAKLPGVVETYAIPSLMVTGERRTDTGPAHYGAPARSPLSIKKMRLLAARAQCDLLLIFDHAYIVDESANGLVALDLLLLPVLFAPQVDVEVESFLDTYAIDVRNGYLYAHVASAEANAEGYLTVWNDVADAFLAKQWDTHLTSTEAHLERVIEESSHIAPRSASR